MLAWINRATRRIIQTQSIEQHMKILLSAYACEPETGSEPSAGWNWAIELVRMGYDVWVLTRANNRPTIEAELAKVPGMRSPRFIYYDLPRWARWWKKGNRGIHLYYLLWQWGAYRLARRIHAGERFDRVHHITFGVVRHPSYMGNLGIPFIFGPVGGGEQAPWRLRLGYGARGVILDALRDVSNLLVKIDPLMWRTFRQADEIYLKTPESRLVIPKRFWSKTRVQLEVGVDVNAHSRALVAQTDRSESFRVLYAGRFLYWKGMHLGIPAFAELLKVVPEARLTLVGKGPDEARWRRLAAR